jgi:peptidyl-prolyl cis-trans isomerase B (cyclophilin B)
VKKLLFALAILLLVPVHSIWAGQQGPKVILKTSLGDIVLLLDVEKAPKTVANFLQYTKDGFYDGTIFHRVIKGFMIQGGGLTTDMAKKQNKPPIANEATNGLSNKKGSIAMARTGDPHSATAQFFINTVNNVSLNHRGTSPQGWGYCVFGKVVSGMDVVDKIAATPTGFKSGRRDVPITPVLIQHAEVMGENKK